MTVCVAIKVHDCIVFAADSAVSLTTTIQGGVSAISKVWRHGLKVFNLHRELPIVAMTAGMGNFGSMSISNLAKNLRIRLQGELCKSSYTIEDVVKVAQLYFQDEHKKSFAIPLPYHSFEFWIGGYGHDKKHGEIWKIEIRGGQRLDPVQLVEPQTSHQIVWGGQVQAICRLLHGYDPQVPQALKLDASQFAAFETPLVDPSMPVQDAIDLADFLVDMTKRYVAFLPGADTVGGETDIATVTKHEGFRWIRRKHYYPPLLNRRTTDHAT